MNEENRIPEEYIVNEGNETGVTMDYIEQLIRSGLRDSGLVLRAPNADEHPNVPRPEDIDTGDRKRLFKGIKQITFEEYETLTEEDRKQYVFFVREESGATFGFVGIGNLKYTMVPEDIRGVDCGYFDCEHIDYNTMYFTLEILTDGTIGWNACGTTVVRTIEYSLNDGEWTSITAGPDSTIDVSAGDIVRFRGNNNSYATSNTAYSGFGGIGTARFNVYGNIMSLLYGDDFVGQAVLPSTWTFCCLFDGSKVVSAQHLVLPATIATAHCYRALFANCLSLVKSPEILPAMALADNCYRYMFNNDSQMVTTPELPAPTLATNCYVGLFNGCGSVNYIKCLAASIPYSSCTSNWVSGVSPSGTFVKSQGMTGWSTGDNGIPSGWSIINA